MHKKHIGTPAIDPTTQADDLMGDTSGLTGITVNKTQSDTAQDSGSVANTNIGSSKSTDVSEEKQPVSYQSDTMKDRAEDIATEEEDNPQLLRDYADNDIPPGNEGQQSNEERLSAEADNMMQKRMAPPSVSGEQSVSGDMPDPESDDDTLQNAQDMGMQLDEDDEHPQEIDIARDIDRAERALVEE
jgi:hypothetical protein